MYLLVEINPNCESEERMFPTTGAPRKVAQVQLERPALGTIWCDVVSVDENGVFGPAQAVQMDDSGAGVAWLVLGGTWGLRLRPTGTTNPWSFSDPIQWGVPFLVLDFSGSGIRFKS